MATPLVTVRINADELQRLLDPQLIFRAEAQMIERGLDVLVPIARAEAPSRTGRGRSQITGTAKPRGNHLVGLVHAGKAFYLRILAVGTHKKPGGYDILPFRYKLTKRGNVSLGARRASRALGPGRARGTMRALRFRAGGGLLFRRMVHHPGFRADDFFQRAATTGERPVAAAAESVMQAALDRATRG